MSAMALASFGMLTHACFNADTSGTMRESNWGEVLGGDYAFRDAQPTPANVASECVLLPLNNTYCCMERP